MYILSFDVASKSLAISVLHFNEKWKSDIDNIKSEFDESKSDNIKNLDAIKTCKLALNYMNDVECILDNMITPIMLDVVDLVPGKKMKDTTVIERTERLAGYLSVLDSYINQLYKLSRTKNKTLIHAPMRIKVLLEYQMGPNDKSRNVGSQILYHYANKNTKFKNTNTMLEQMMKAQNTKMYQNGQIITYDIDIIGPSLKNKINLSDKNYKHFIEKYAKSYDANKSHSKANFTYWIESKNSGHLAKNIKKKNIDDIADSVTMTLAWIYLKSGFVSI
jgi:hypothetical protein